MAQTVTADIDGDGTNETVTFDGTQTTVARNGSVLWDHTGWIDGWNRRASDRVQPADVNGDGHQELLVVNAPDLWTGLLQWDGSQLHVMWAAPPPTLHGVAGAWNRRSDDQFLPVDLDGDGRDELVVSNGTDRWTGVLKFANGALGPVWMTPSPIQGPTGQWNRLPGDLFQVNTGNPHLVDIYSPNNEFGIFRWQNGALVPGMMWAGSPPEMTFLPFAATDTSLQPQWRPLDSDLIVDITISWSPPSASGTHDDTLASTAVEYLIEGLSPGTPYTLALSYDVVGGYTPVWATVDVETAGTAPPPPPPPHEPMPNLVGETLAQAITVIDGLQLDLWYIDNPSLGTNDAVVVTSQNPTAGTAVTAGTRVSLAVLPRTSVGFSAVQVTNQNADGRSIDVYLSPTTTPNIAQSAGTVALNESTTIQLPNPGRSYVVIAVDTGLIGCPGDQPFNGVCQRGVTPAVLCTQPGLTYQWSVG